MTVDALGAQQAGSMVEEDGEPQQQQNNNGISAYKGYDSGRYS